MDKSIELLCSMSPKVKSKYNNFRFKKGTTILALKRHIRQSTIHDKSVRTVKNANLNILESSTTVSTESSSSVKILNETPIIISDSDLSGSSDPINENSDDNKELSILKVRNSLPQNKRDEIQNWIENIDTQNKYHETINYTELSTIYGDLDDDHFQPKEKGNAVNSTFATGSCKRFNEVLQNLSRKNNSNNEILNNSHSDIIINESVDSNKSNSDNTSLSRNTSSFRLVIDETLDNNKNCLECSTTKVTVRKKIFSNGLDEFKTNSLSPSVSREYVNCNTPTLQEDNEKFGEESELESLLDNFYGNKWREKQDLILPMTEPKNRVTKLTDITQSERKPKTSLLYKNPYLEKEIVKSQNLLQNLHRSRLKYNTDSPMTEKLKKLCDPDLETSSEKEEDFHDARARLNFDSDDDMEKTNSKNTKNKIEAVDSDDKISNKENFDLSDLGQSLEERIKKKIFKIKDVPSSASNQNTKKTSTKKTNSKLKSITNINPKSNFDNNFNKGKSIPEKSKKSDKKFLNDSSTSSDEEWDKEISKITYEAPKMGKYTFLASLSDDVPILKCDMSARIFRSNFKSFKGELLTKLFKLYNEEVFKNAIPQDTIFEWNDRMRTTAGFCYCKKITRRTGAVERSARIVLASKIIDCPGRLRDTLIHELCHAATWIVNCVSDGHGQYWKAWAFKAMKMFPELPPIKRCHEYGINTKYTYKCTGCGYSIGRHSKSLDIERKRCGYCYGKFEILINKVSKKGEIKSVPTPKREANRFALFVKENYGRYKDSAVKHGDVMKILGQKFQEMKVDIWLEIT